MLSVSSDLAVENTCDKSTLYTDQASATSSKINKHDTVFKETCVIVRQNTSDSYENENVDPYQDAESSSISETDSQGTKTDKQNAETPCVSSDVTDSSSSKSNVDYPDIVSSAASSNVDSNSSVHDSLTDKNFNLPNSVRYIDYQGVDTEEFVRNVLIDNPKERQMLFQLEKEMIDFIKNKECRFHNFSPMSSYHRMIVHRIATYFGLDHNVDQSGRFIIVTKTNKTRIPEKSFEELIPQSEQFQKQILKRPEDCQLTIKFDQAIVGDERTHHHLSIEERQKAYETRRAEIFNNSSQNDAAVKSFFSRQNSRTFRNDKRYHNKPKAFTRNPGHLFPASLTFTHRPNASNRYSNIQANYVQYAPSNTHVAQTGGAVKMMPCSSVILQQPYRYWSPVYPSANYTTENDLIPALENMNLKPNNGLPVVFMPTSCLNNQLYFQNSNDPNIHCHNNVDNAQPVTSISSSFSSFMPYVLVNPPTYSPRSVTAQTTAPMANNNNFPNGLQYVPNTVFQQKQSMQQSFPFLQKISPANNAVFIRQPFYVPQLSRKSNTDSDMGAYTPDCIAVEVVGGLDTNLTVRTSSASSSTDVSESTNIAGLRIFIVFNRWVSFDLLSQQVLPLQIVRCDEPHPRLLQQQ